MSGAHNRWNTTPLPLFANDFLNGTSELSDQAVGRYIRLLCYQWLKGSVPADPEYAADLQIFAPAEANADACASRAARAKMILESYFEVDEGRARNLRLEADREKVKSKSRKARDAAAKRWEQERLEESLRLAGECFSGEERYTDEDANASTNEDADDMPPSPNPTTTSEGEANASPSNYVEQRTVLSYPCRGNPKQWDLTEEQVGKWKALYPGLDVLTCCRKALAWCDSDGRRRKTANGMPRFLVNWMNREVDRGTSRLSDSSGSSAGGRTDLAGRPESDRLCRLNHGERVGSDPKNPKYRDILALDRLAAEVGIGEAWERRLKPPVLVTEKPPPLCARCEDAYDNEEHECKPPEGLA